MQKFYIVLLFLTCGLAAQEPSQVNIEAEIDAVTVFLEGAQVFRSGNATVPGGKSFVKLQGLSPYIDEKSVQVKGLGDFTIISVSHEYDYLKLTEKREEGELLQEELDGIKRNLALNKSRKEVLKEKVTLLQENKNFGSQQQAATVPTLREALDFYDESFSKIKEEELQISAANEELSLRLKQLTQELKKLNGEKTYPTGTVIVELESKQGTDADFEFSYHVHNAGWHPKYELRAKNVEQPLEAIYRAQVYQQTGVDWNNVKLKLSNGNPSRSASAPQLATWYLNFARNTIITSENYRSIQNVREVSGVITDKSGEPLIGVSVIVDGTSIGTVSDINGAYSLALPSQATLLTISYIGFESQSRVIDSNVINFKLKESSQLLDEVVVVGYGSSDLKIRGLSSRAAGVRVKSPAKQIVTTQVVNTTTIEQEVDRPYSIKTNEKPLSVYLNTFELETEYQYYAVPKLDKAAYLIASISNWNQFNLLEGEANLFFEDTYIGRTIFDARSMDDTLKLSLGPDKSVLIDRTKVSTYSKKRIIGLNKVASREFEIELRNNKAEEITLTLFDQIPVAAINDIAVNPTEISGAELDEQSGQLTWKKKFDPNEMASFILAFEVKYPKRERLYLE